MTSATTHFARARAGMRARETAGETVRGKSFTIYVIRENSSLRNSLLSVLTRQGFSVRFYKLRKFISLAHADIAGCVLMDAVPGKSEELLLLESVRPIAGQLKAILIAGDASVRFAVEAVRAGAFDVLQAPVQIRQLLTSVREAIDTILASDGAPSLRRDTESPPIGLASLTLRQREILQRILEGQSSRIIAAELGISQRNTGYHRALIMKKMGAESISRLIQLALADRQHP